MAASGNFYITVVSISYSSVDGLMGNLTFDTKDTTKQDVPIAYMGWWATSPDGETNPCDAGALHLGKIYGVR